MQHQESLLKHLHSSRPWLTIKHIKVRLCCGVLSHLSQFLKLSFYQTNQEFGIIDPFVNFYSLTFLEGKKHF